MVNLLLNPSFENGDILPDYWWNYESAGFSGVLELVNEAYSGAKAYKVTNNSPLAVGAISQTVIIPEGVTKVKFGVMTKNTIESDSGIGYVAVIMDCYSSPDTGFTWLGTVESKHDYDSNSSYHNLSGVAVLPVGTYQVNLSCAVALVAGVATFDNAYLEEQVDVVDDDLILILLGLSIFISVVAFIVYKRGKGKT